MEIFLGIALVLFVLGDVFQTIVVPRTVFRVVPLMVRFLLWPVYKRFCDLESSARYRNALLEIFAPGAFTIMIFTWLTILILGYGLIFYGLRTGLSPPIATFYQAVYFSGIAIFTIGFGDVVPIETSSRLAVLAGAASGLLFMALAVSFLFTLQTLLQQREQIVNTLISRAGTPASGLVILLRYKELNIIPSLGSSFVAWEIWVAGILESHRTHPLLFYFRSSTKGDSWLSAMGAMLDASALLSTTIRGVTVGESELFYWLASSTLKSLCIFFRLPLTEEVHMTFEEFKEGTELLRLAGYQTIDDELAWKLFSLRRRAYAGYLHAISTSVSLQANAWIHGLAISQLGHKTPPKDSAFQRQL